jgi:hypothetical protein
MRAFIGKRVGPFYAGVSQRVHMPSFGRGFSLGIIIGVAIGGLCAIFFGAR